MVFVLVEQTEATAGPGQCTVGSRKKAAWWFCRLLKRPNIYWHFASSTPTPPSSTQLEGLSEQAISVVPCKLVTPRQSAVVEHQVVYFPHNHVVDQMEAYHTN